MPVLLQYRLDDGTITGRWEATTWTLLNAQIVPDDPTYGYYKGEDLVGIGVLHEQYYISEGGTLTEKTVLTLTALPTPFSADGVMRCEVSVTPFVPCTLLVDGTALQLTAEDPVLELTADDPHRFQIGLLPVAGVRADPLVVEAV